MADNGQHESILEREAAGRRLRRLRIQQGLTVETASNNARVHPNSWNNWERGRVAYRSYRCPTIAAALGVPVAQLFTDGSVLAEITLSEDTLRKVRNEGRQASEAAAGRLAAQLEPLIYAEATRPAVDARPGARPKRRRSRVEKLAGIQAANKARARRQAVSQAPAFTTQDT